MTQGAKLSGSLLSRTVKLSMLNSIENYVFITSQFVVNNLQFIILILVGLITSSVAVIVVKRNFWNTLHSFEIVRLEKNMSQTGIKTWWLTYSKQGTIHLGVQLDNNSVIVELRDCERGDLHKASAEIVKKIYQERNRKRCRSIYSTSPVQLSAAGSHTLNTL